MKVWRKVDSTGDVLQFCKIMEKKAASDLNNLLMIPITQNDNGFLSPVSNVREGSDDRFLPTIFFFSFPSVKIIES